MITSLLQGGLGNQMFQVAAATSLAKKNGDEACFNLHNHHLPNQGRKCHNYIDNVFRNVDFSSPVRVLHSHHETSYKYEEINYTPQMALIGFFQSEKYFKEHQDDIRQLFSIDSCILDIIKEKYGYLLERETAFLHVRLGDYVKYKDHHPPCSLDYYKEATSRFPENTIFLVFSDDIEWCKGKFQDERFVFIHNNEDYIDLYLMTLCKSAIMANSSFSWWGAWLGEKEKVIAPSRWFGEGSKNNTKDLYVQEWTIL